MLIKKYKALPFFISRTMATAALLSVGYVAPVQSQDESGLEEITVTGSRIVRRDYEANSPIMSVESEMFERVSGIGIETALNQLPQFIPSLTQFNNEDFQASATITPGASTLSLRGLDSNRNLILLDGSRAMPVNARMAVDMNSIPSAAIQRVEVITGGASSVYGADAVAGVVNFILKKDFEGLDFDAQAGITEHGDGAETRTAALFGANFGDGNGNVMMGLEFARRQAVHRRDRAFFRNAWADPTVEGAEFFSTDTSFQFPGNPPSQAAIDSVFTTPVPNPTFPEIALPAAGAIPGAGEFYLNPDNTLYQGGADFGAVGASNPAGLARYQGETIVDGVYKRKLDQQGHLEENATYGIAQTPLDRYAMFGRARYEIVPNIETFIQGNFTQTESRTVFQLSPAIGGWSLNIPHGRGIYEPSVVSFGADGLPNTADAGEDMTTIADYLAGGPFGVVCPAVGGCTDSQAFPTPPELTTLLASRGTGNYATDPLGQGSNGFFQLNDLQDYVPPRILETQTRTYQLSVGFNGELESIDGSWNAVFSHGDSLTTTEYVGFMSLSRYRAIGQSANYGRNFFQQGNEQQGGFSSGIGQCSSGLLFFDDKQGITQDCIDSMRAEMQNTSQMRQNFAEFNVQGRAFDLPAGEARFALGAHYRQNDYEYLFDPLNTQSSFTDLGLGQFPAGNARGKTSVKEVYGEALLPVFRDVPFVQELNLELGYRYSDYNNIGGVDTYKALADWTVNDSIRLRGGYQLATRAPNIAELFEAETQIFVVTGPDACGLFSQAPNGANPAINPNAAASEALCRDLMGATAAAQYYADRTAAGQPNPFVFFTFSNAIGNPEVQAEEATTWTAGLVYQSDSEHPLLRNLSMSVDWYQIEIENMIALESIPVVYDKCLSVASNPTRDVNHPSCQQVLRSPVNGFQLPTDVSYTNTASALTSGLDLQLNWNSELADLGIGNLPGSLGVNVLFNYLMDFETQSDPAEPVVDWKGTLGPSATTSLNAGAYDYRIFTTFNYYLNNVNVSLRWRHLPTADSEASAINTGPVPQLGATESYNIVDMSGSYAINDQYSVRVGIDNLFDTDPVITGASTDLGGSLPTSGAGTTNFGFYDVLGRRFYVGFKAQF